MTALVLLLIAWQLIGIALLPLYIGKPRDPISAGEAAVMFAIACLHILAISAIGGLL